jgi:hypothetical protein
MVMQTHCQCKTEGAPWATRSSRASTYRSAVQVDRAASKFHDGIVGRTAAIEKDLEQIRAQRVQRRPCLHLAIGGYQVVYGAIDAAVTIV